DIEIKYENAVKMNNFDNLPGFRDLRCTIAATPSQLAALAGVQINCRLKNYRFVGEDDDISFQEPRAFEYIPAGRNERSRVTAITNNRALGYTTVFYELQLRDVR